MIFHPRHIGIKNRYYAPVEERKYDINKDSFAVFVVAVVFLLPIVVISFGALLLILTSLI
jgi:hypothetical protein